VKINTVKVIVRNTDSCSTQSAKTDTTILDVASADHQCPNAQIMISMMESTFLARKRSNLEPQNLFNVLVTRNMTQACAILDVLITTKALDQFAGERTLVDGSAVEWDQQKTQRHVDRSFPIRFLALELWL